MDRLQKEVKYLFIDKTSNLYNQAIELRYKEFFEEFNCSRESIFDEFEESSMHIVAYIDQKVIGYARLFIENSTGEISQLVIDNEYKEMNIGCELINILINEAIERNLKLIGLDACANGIDFYRNLGFETLGDIFFSNQTDLPHVRMIKEL